MGRRSQGGGRSAPGGTEKGESRYRTGAWAFGAKNRAGGCAGRWGALQYSGLPVDGFTSAASAPTESYPDVFHNRTDRKVPHRMGSSEGPIPAP
eukprot:scaffold14936_cov89-Isochrysis_galbana.AAC.5